MDYISNLKTFDKYGRRSVYEIQNLNPNIPSDWEIIKREYRAVDIDKVVIDENVFVNYGQYQFLWEKAYVKEPKRSSNGSLGNLNSFATFITPHLIINFDVMSIDDYRAIMRLHLSANEFVVKCYDPIYNQTIKVKMYFTTEQMAKLNTIKKKRFNGTEWEDWVQLVGVNEYSVELVGTNSDLDLVNVTYHLNPPSDTGLQDKTQGEEDVYRGEEVIIGNNSDFQSETFSSKYKFSKWTTSDGDIYIDGYAYTINSNLVLYAQWDSAEEHTLSFSYGLADPVIDNIENTYETNRKVVTDKDIGILPTPKTPQVVVNGATYSPYYNGKWYKTPIKTINSQPISNNTKYWTNRDSTIYYIYDVNTYSIIYYIDGKRHSTERVEYNAQIPLPQLVKDGYVFDGWYTSKEFLEETKASGNMPPYELSLYARWKENE